MENHLGRKLRTDEHVHHIDGDGHNNAISNLIVESIQEHMRFHQSPGQPRNYRHTDEVRARIGAAHRGKKMSKDAKAKISVALKEHWRKRNADRKTVSESEPDTA